MFGILAWFSTCDLIGQEIGKKKCQMFTFTPLPHLSDALVQRNLELRQDTTPLPSHLLEKLFSTVVLLFEKYCVTAVQSRACLMLFVID